MYGSIKYSGEPGRSGMETGFSIAKLKQGVIGVTVRMLKNDYKLPDVISVGGELPKQEVKEVVSQDGAKGE